MSIREIFEKVYGAGYHDVLTRAEPKDAMAATVSAALRSVKPEDISDAMVEAFHSTKVVAGGDPEWFRRALAAAIAAGA